MKLDMQNTCYEVYFFWSNYKRRVQILVIQQLKTTAGLWTLLRPTKQSLTTIAKALERNDW